MSTPTDMLVDLGLNLSDSELEDSAPAFLGNRGADAEIGDDGESDISDISSGECSSGDDDMDAIPGEGATVASVAEAPASTSSSCRMIGEPPPRTQRPMRSQIHVDGAPRGSSDVWSRLGRRVRSASDEACKKLARLEVRATGGDWRRRRRRDNEASGAPRRGGGGSHIATSAGSYPPVGDVRANLRSFGRRRRRRRARGAGLYRGAHYERRAPRTPATITPPPQDHSRVQPDAIDPGVMARLHSIIDRSSAERVGGSFVRSSQIMRNPFGGPGFRTTNSPWAPVLAPVSAPYEAETRRVSWHTLVEHGPSLYRTFASEGRASATARALRECVLRQENLTSSLASADELFSWCKMCVQHKLPIQSRDPIVATAGAVLETLATRLRPFMQCYLRTRGLRSLDDLCSRRRLSDVKDIASFMFVILARIANRVERGVEELDYGTLGVPPGMCMDFYIPGACVAGVIEILDTHRQECSSRICELTASHIIASDYVHGKYFYCNSLF
ncbi:multifunctional expression regulator [Bovine alphaherpesvirus 2]|uniref:Multifunctional expression regulator n=1 Tax=Bovine alphaherpesvirus 2 TaxID=10295 RepID=A0ABX6WLV4_9ALPH|nr:multifunctional expression regulator [Bovine alphaherpesvirus 2]QPO25188.1 multifunctional expression regulator [Bovine alphaherpesvirus 2]